MEAADDTSRNNMSAQEQSFNMAHLRLDVNLCALEEWQKAGKPDFSPVLPPRGGLHCKGVPSIGRLQAPASLDAHEP